MAKNNQYFKGKSTVELTCKSNCMNHHKLCKQCCYGNKDSKKSEFKPIGVK